MGEVVAFPGLRRAPPPKAKPAKKPKKPVDKFAGFDSHTADYKRKAEWHLEHVTTLTPEERAMLSVIVATSRPHLTRKELETVDAVSVRVRAESQTANLL